MKVLQVGKYFQPAVGGIETVVRTLSLGLVKRGVQVTVLAYSNEVSSLERASIDGVDVIRAPTQMTLLSQPISLHYLHTLTTLAPSYDILHFHSPNPLAEAAALTLKGDTPFVVSYHAEAIKQKLVLALYKPILDRFLEKASRVAISSSSLLQSQKPLQSISSKCKVIPFGIEESSPDQLSRIESLALEKKQKYGDFCLFVGRLVHYKGVYTLIEAVYAARNQCPQLKLLIIGNGPLFLNLKKRIKSLHLENQVHLLGKVEDELDLKSFYKACDFLVLPSLSKAEAFGIVLLEAMIFSKPVITTQILSGVSDVNRDQMTGLQIEPGNPEQLASAMIQLTEDQELRKKLGLQARHHILTRFNVNSMIDETLKMYENAIKDHHT